MAHSVRGLGFAETAPAATGNPLLLKARSRVGSTLRGKWRLDALLGVGGMAAVYAATHRNGSRAAVKILHPELALDREMRGRFLREGRIANAVGHDGTVKVLDDDTSEDGSVLLVLELLEGESLEARCLRLGRRLPEIEVLWVADQLLDVLAAAHGRGIVHRDIKPDNVFLTRSGNLKVLDFGIAHFRQLTTASTATRGGETMGTLAFMSPEQARGLWEEVDGQSDLFALGATMFTLLSGVFLHDGSNPNEQIVSAMTVPAPPLAGVVPGVADSVAHVVDVALAFDKSNRWASAAHMQEAVRNAYRDRTGRPITMAPRPIVPGVVANRGLEAPEAVAVPGHSPSVRSVVRSKSQWTPSKRLAVAFTAGVATVVAMSIAIAGPGYSKPAQGAATLPRVPSPLASPAADTTAPLGAGVERSSSPAESPPVVASDRTSASARRSAPRPSPAPSFSPAPKPAPACTAPFTVDPVTHFKHWKVQCL